MHERRGAEREYSCNICGEVFRNIFPQQAHQRYKHQVGAGKRRQTDRQAGRQADRQTGRQADRQTGRKIVYYKNYITAQNC